jgi:hypothetical protein
MHILPKGFVQYPSLWNITAAANKDAPKENRRTAAIKIPRMV